MKLTRINKKIAFLGAGNMASALISGLLNAKALNAGNIIVSDIDKSKVKYLNKKYKVKPGSSNRDAVKKSDVIFISVKPQNVGCVISEISVELNKNKLLVSIAAGITTSFIEKNAGKRVSVIRTMPNTPALLGQGAIGLSRGKFASLNDVKLVKQILLHSGVVLEFAENKLDAVTALSGSGPAYVFYLAEAMEQAGREMGLKAIDAKLLARKTVYGAGLMLDKLDAPSDILRKNVTSPGGTTEAAIRHMNENKMTDIIKQAIKKAKKRAVELKK